MRKFVAFGETMVTYTPRYIGPDDESRADMREYEVYCAGTESNVVLDIERLGINGVQTVWISRVGDDKEGEMVLESLRGRTMVAAPKLENTHTGICYMSNFGRGQISKTYRRKGSAASHLTFEEIEPHLTDADVLHITGIKPALSCTTRKTTFDALNYAEKKHIPVSFDGNYREAIWTPGEASAIFDRIIPYSTVFKVGHDEAETVWKFGWTAIEYAHYFQEINQALVIVTMGSEGALAFDGENTVHPPGYEIEVLDPVGAGDAFIAGFLGLVLQEHRVTDFLLIDRSERASLVAASMRVANACGAIVCMTRGDVEPMPTMTEAVTFLREQEAC